MPLEPLPETVEALHAIGEFATEDVVAELSGVAAEVAQVAPECVGMSVVDTSDDDGLLDEGRWVAFARAGAAAGILSTLSMPLGSVGSGQGARPAQRPASHRPSHRISVGAEEGRRR
jgi:hypothetical protein